MSDAPHKPLVSFIVASHNYGRYVGTTLASILDQTVQEMDIIVIDDASTDNSLEVIRSFDDQRIRLHVNETNIGIASTYNKGLSLARGDYITILDADDWIEPGKIEEQLLVFRRNPEIAIVGTYVKVFDDHGRRHPDPFFEQFWNQAHDFNALESWIGQNKLNACSPLIARHVFDEIGHRDATLAIASDYEFWVRAHACGHLFGTVAIPLLCYRIHENNVSMHDRQTVFLEQCYVMQKTILPTIARRSAHHLLPIATEWVTSHDQFSLMSHEQAGRLLGLLAEPQPCTDCVRFKAAVLGT
jgi:glycosyltransferase involved in cell wall biosynthesis